LIATIGNGYIQHNLRLVIHTPEASTGYYFRPEISGIMGFFKVT